MEYSQTATCFPCIGCKLDVYLLFIEYAWCIASLDVVERKRCLAFSYRSLASINEYEG